MFLLYYLALVQGFSHLILLWNNADLHWTSLNYKALQQKCIKQIASKIVE